MTPPAEQPDLLPITALGDAADAPRRWSPIEARVAALAVTVAIYVVAFGMVAGLALHFGRTPWISRFIPYEPLLVLGTGLLLAHCSLIAIWWTQSAWPSHGKTLVAALGWLGTWALLIALFPLTDVQSAAGGGWAVCLGTQTAIVALALLMGRSWAHWRGGKPFGTFSLLTLFLWTSLIAVLLGAGRSLVLRLGWTEEIFHWQFFRQVRALGEANAVLGVTVYFTITAAREWRSKVLGSVVAIITITGGTAAAMRWQFADVGAPLVELCWLIGAQGVFLLATLVPLEMARDSTEDVLGS